MSRHQRINRRLRQCDEKQAAALKALAERAYSVIRYSEHHYRVDRNIDFWPITGRWRQMNGAFEGVGLPALLEKLRELS